MNAERKKTSETRRKKGSKALRSAMDRAVAGAKRVGGRVAHAVAETPEYVATQRTDRALRSEIDDHLRSIGRRALILHKRSRGEPPFARFREITRELETVSKLEEEYRENRARLNDLRREMRRGK
jgi:hypothetical protein